MLLRRAHILQSPQCRLYATILTFRPVSILPDNSLSTFRNLAFDPAVPALLPRGQFDSLPAARKWFTRSDGPHSALQLNTSYLSRFGSTIVPLEITNNGQFTQVQNSLSFFLECVNASQSTYITKPHRYFSSYVPGARAVRRKNKSNSFFSASSLTAPTARVYLAQASLQDLSQALRDDVPTPELVLEAGKGDVYDTSIWLGQAPTYTPLHRDPNPNLFVQLAGKKIVRLFTPEQGRAIFAEVQEKIGGAASATMRGVEMMQGAEKKALEAEVWSEEKAHTEVGWQAELDGGDGMFIPKGWWHSVKGIGEGMTGSVNWWFR